MRSSSLWEKTSQARRRAFGLTTERCTSVMTQIVTSAVSDGDLELKDGQSAIDICFGLWAMSLGSHMLAGAPQMLVEIGLKDVDGALRQNQDTLLDGLGWKPLFTKWDYAKTYDRIFKEIFTDYPRPAAQS